MNLSEFRRAINRRSGVDYDSAALTEVVNEALQSIAAEADWPWLEKGATLTTVAGTGSYAMPTDWVRTRGVTFNGDEMRFLSVRDIDDDTTIEGYSTSGDALTISPTPASAAVVKMRYLATENALAADGDLPKLPAAYHGAVVAYGLAVVHRRKGNHKAAESYEEAYRGWIARIRKGITRTTGPRRIRVRAGSAL